MALVIIKHDNRPFKTNPIKVNMIQHSWPKRRLDENMRFELYLPLSIVKSYVLKHLKTVQAQLLA